MTGRSRKYHYMQPVTPADKLRNPSIMKCSNQTPHNCRPHWKYGSSSASTEPVAFSLVGTDFQQDLGGRGHHEEQVLSITGRKSRLRMRFWSLNFFLITICHCHQASAKQWHDEFRGSGDNEDDHNFCLYVWGLPYLNIYKPARAHESSNLPVTVRSWSIMGQGKISFSEGVESIKSTWALWQYSWQENIKSTWTLPQCQLASQHFLVCPRKASYQAAKPG